MSLLLEQLQNKPVPEKNVSVEVFIPKEGQIEIKTTLIDKRKEGYNRKNLREKMRKRGLIASLPVKKSVKFKRSKKLKLKGAEPENDMLPKKKKFKKLGKRLKISKKISKGTITGFAEPGQSKLVVKTSRK